MGCDYANTRVFWDLEDFPVPEEGVEDLSIFSWNVEKALTNEGFEGSVSIYAYGGGQTDEEAEAIGSSRNFSFFRGSEKDARHHRMIMDMICWACSERPSRDDDGQHTNLMVIAKDVPEKDSPFFKVLKELDDLCYNILLVLPEEGLQLHSCAKYTAQELLALPIILWRWKSLFRGGPPFFYTGDDDESSQIFMEELSSQQVVVPHNTDSTSHIGSSSFVEAKAEEPMWEAINKDFNRDFTYAPTTVFWDVVDFPLPRSMDLVQFRRAIEGSLRINGNFGHLKIHAYGSEEKSEQEMDYYAKSGFTYVSKGPKYWRLTCMLSDIGLWSLKHLDPYLNPTILMVIARNDMSKATSFVDLLQDLAYSSFRVLLVVPPLNLPLQEPVPSMISAAWCWLHLLSVRRPMRTRRLERLIALSASNNYDLSKRVMLF